MLNIPIQLLFYDPLADFRVARDHRPAFGRRGGSTNESYSN